MKQRKRGIRRMFAGAMAALMMLSVVDVSGWGVMNAKAEETAVQVNDSAGKTEQQSTEEEECKHEGVEITFNNNGFGNCPKCNATVYQPAVETTDKYDIDDDSTKDTVYEISNAGQLYWFAGLVNGTLDGVKQNTLANAVLTANITVNENLLDSLQYDAEGNVSNGSDFISWTPIADCMEDHITQYSGTFDGNNKTVSGLYFTHGPIGSPHQKSPLLFLHFCMLPPTKTVVFCQTTWYDNGQKKRRGRVSAGHISGGLRP